MTGAPAEPVFLLPKDLDFACTSCGRCCRDKWEIRVDAPSAEKLLARDWKKTVPELGETVPFKKRLPVALEKEDGELGWTIERRGCGSCVFLTQNNLCAIHAELGLREKPQVCQQFPFLFSESREGVSVGLSHYCPGVVRRDGATSPPLLAQEAELRRLHAHALRVERCPERVLADDGLALSWEDYAAFERFLRDLLALGQDVPSTLTALVLAAAMLADFLQQRTAGKEATPAGAARDFVAGWQRMGPARIVEIARRQQPAPRAGRSVLRQFLSLVDVSSADETLGPLARAFRAALVSLKEVLGFGSAYCLPLDARVSLRAVRNVEFPWEDAALSLPLLRYADHAIERRRLLPVLGARVGLALLVLHVASARYVARAKAALDGRARATAEDVATGIQLVEKHYATHSRLGEAFARGAARVLFRKIAARPRWSLAVLRS